MSMFCGVTEAFNSPLKQQIEEMEKENRINEYKQKMIQEVNNDRNNNSVGIDFFTAQGDMYQGTPIKNLDNNSLDTSSFFSDSEGFESLPSSMTQLTDSSLKKTLPNKSDNIEHMVDHSHEYYLRNFLGQTIGGDKITDHNTYNDICDHVRTCKYCKDEINLRISGKEAFSSIPSKIENKPEPKQHIEHFNANELVNKSNIKEVIIIIVIGISIVFIIDLFIRIRKKLNN